MGLEGVLKELMHRRYTDGVQNQLMNKVPIRRRVEKDFSKENFEGSRVVDAVLLGRNATGRWMKEHDPFPLAGNSTVRNTAIFCSWFRASGAVAYTTNVRTKVRAFANALSLEVMGLKDDAANKMERVACMDGTGLLCKIEKVDATHFRCSATKAVRLEEGLPIHFWTVGNTADFDDASTTKIRPNPAGKSYYTIASIDFDIDNTITDEFGHTVPAALVTLSEGMNSAVATGDYVVTAGALVVNDANTQVMTTEPQGIGGIIGMNRNYSSTPYDTKNFGATFQTKVDGETEGASDEFNGLSPTTWPRWRPVSYNAGGSDLSPFIIERVLTLIKTRSGKSIDDITEIFVNSIQTEIWRKNRYSEERVYLSPESGNESGNRGQTSSRSERLYPTFAGIPIVDGRYFDDDKAYVSMSKSMRIMVIHKFQLWTLGDGGFHKAYNRAPEIHFEWQGLETMAPSCRNCNAVIYDLSTSVN